MIRASNNPYQSTPAIVYPNLFKGNFPSLEALELAYPEPESGSTANIIVVDGPNDLAVWDTDDSVWIIYPGAGVDISGKEDSVNKVTTMTGNTSSNIFFLTAKAIYDWVNSFFVPNARTISINGTTQDLSSNRTYTVLSNVTLTKVSITSSVLTKLDVDGFLIYINGVTSFSIGTNERVRYVVTDTGQIFDIEVNNRNVGVGETPLNSSHISYFSDYSFKNNTHFSRSARWKAIGGTTATTLEQLGAILNYPVGYTGTKVNPTTQNWFQTLIVNTERLVYRSSATSGSSCGFNTGQSNVYPIGQEMGFDIEIKFDTSDLASISTSSLFVGLTKNTTDIGNVNPSTLLNCFGIGNDENDSNLRLIHNDGAGTATYTDLGISFPSNAVNSFYKFRVYKKPGLTTPFSWNLDLYSNSPISDIPIASVSGSVSSDLPSTSSNRGLAWQIHRCNRSTASAVEIAVSIVSLKMHY